MGVIFHNYVSPYSFAMGVLWFNAFIIIGLLMRKLKFPIKFSTVPLLFLLALSVLRMFVVIEVPGATIVLSETLYPAIVNFFRFELVLFRPFGLSINIAAVFICIWITGTICLVAKYAKEYIGRFPSLLQWYVDFPRDKRAEALLSEIIGRDKHFRVFRSGCFNTPLATAFKPYIILPSGDFSDGELRVMLLHEWKHIQDKDYLTHIVVNLICFVFWWNPIVYILRGNFKFATELKCDGFAVPNKQDFQLLLSALLKLDDLEKGKTHARTEGNAFVDNDAELVDRLKILAMRGESQRGKKILTNTCYSIAIVALFLASYMFTVLPIFWESPYVPVPVEDFMEMYNEGEGTFRTYDIFLVDNADGTFSYYVDGLFVMYVEDGHDIMKWVPVRARQ